MEKTNDSKMATWFKGLKAEFRKIIWPDSASLARQSVAVIITSVVVGLLIAIIDVGVQYGVDFLVGLHL